MFEIDSDEHISNVSPNSKSQENHHKIKKTKSREFVIVYIFLQNYIIFVVSI